MKDEQFNKAQDVRSDLFNEQDKLLKFTPVLERILKIKHEEPHFTNDIKVCFDGVCCELDMDKSIRIIKLAIKQSKGKITKLENEFKKL